jgi:hypothetical protein
MSRLKSISGVAAFVLPFVLGGCAAEPSPEEAAEADLQRLRGLPYASSTPINKGEKSGVVVHETDRSWPGYNLYTVQKLSMAVLMDAQGQMIRVWRHAPSGKWARAELLANGDLLAIGSDLPEEGRRRFPDEARYLLRFDWEGNLLWKRYLNAHHDIERTPRGPLLVIDFRRRQLPEIDPSVDVRDDQLSLLDESGLVLERLSLFDVTSRSPHVFPLQKIDESNVGVVPWIDIFHANSVEWMSRPHLEARHPIYSLSNILISFRHQDRIAVVDWDERRVVWAWGEGELQGPHDARVLDNGHILVFDNGLGRRWSRVLEIDPVTERIVWEYRASEPRSFYTPTKGSSQRLPNGNTLISDSDSGRAFEVTSDGETVWAFNSPHVTETGQRAVIVRMIRFEEDFVRRLLAGGQENRPSGSG